MIRFRKLNKYKYQLMNSYEHAVNIPGDIETDFVKLAGSKLFIREHYAWDGASGPAIDTNNIMRGSLVHDAIYQLIRLGKVDYIYRIEADKLLRDISRQDGMNRFRAWYVYWAVRLCARSSAKPKSEIQIIRSEERV